MQGPATTLGQAVPMPTVADRISRIGSLAYRVSAQAEALRNRVNGPIPTADQKIASTETIEGSTMEIERLLDVALADLTTVATQLGCSV